MKTFLRYVVVIMLVLLGGSRAFAVEKCDTLWTDDEMEMDLQDSLLLDSLKKAHGTAIQNMADSLKIDTARFVPSKFENWKPDPIRSMWLGLVIPGGGQIYNRKYWKLPIFYGGVIGCIYAMTWNGQMLRDYSQAYQDLTDDDPTTKSYVDMLPINYKVEGRESSLISMFQRKKKFYRRNRDLSIFCIVGVYALSIIDAYVDAELSTFDISRDLSLHWSPAYISAGPRSVYGGGPGISLQLKY